jgi:prolyl-tRNA editing enzyme YbaK/EbsC (Cys-tRNA(Pro) deacylase)
LLNPDPSVYDRIVRHLTAAGVVFRTVEHPPTLTSLEAARARGEPLGCGAKALVLKGDGAFRLFVLAADRKLQSKLIKTALGLRDLRFATAEELLALTGLVPGGVPPFGEPVLPLPLFADIDLGTRFPHIAFNAGDLCRSIIMPAADWEEAARPVRLRFAAEEA